MRPSASRAHGRPPLDRGVLVIGSGSERSRAENAGGRWLIAGRQSATLSAMSESLHMTIVFEQGEDGWIVASIPAVPGAHSQGKTRAEARANVIDALRGILALRFGEHPAVATTADSELLELVIGA